MRPGKAAGGRFDPKSRGSFDKSKSWNYCRKMGHWKAECPALQFRSRGAKPNVKPVAAAAPVVTGSVLEMFTPTLCEDELLAAFAPFIRDGFVSMVGSDTKIPVKILRDMAAFDSYIVDSVLPLSADSDTGELILSRGMGLNILPIPLHKLVLDCELMQGEVSVGVRPALPVEGVHVILGYGLAGSRVWTNVPVSPVVTPCPVVSENPRLQQVVPACEVTRAMAKSEPDAVPDGEGCDVDFEDPSLADFPLSASHEELV